MDRRVRKTRALLQKGFIELLQEKDISDISVKELSDLVDINRGTFYLHYSDIYDMLHKIEEELFIEFKEILDRNLMENSSVQQPDAVMLDFFVFLEKNREIAKVMTGPHGDLAFVNHLKALVRERLMHLREFTGISEEHFIYHYSFIVSGCIGIIEAWLNSSAPPAPEEIAALCSRMIKIQL